MYLSAVDFPAFHCVYAGGVDARMAEDVGKADDVLLYAVIRSGEQVTEIVREYFFLADVGRRAQFFHIRPYIRSVKRVAVPSHKNGAA